MKIYGAAGVRRSQAILMTRRKPATTGEILIEELMKPIGLTRCALADVMGEQCNDRRYLSAATALVLARAFGAALISGPMCSGAAICGKRCIHRANGTD